MAKLKTGPKVILAAALIGGGVYGAKWYVTTHGETKMATVVPKKTTELVEFKTTETAPATPGAPQTAALPSATPAKSAAPKVRMLIIPWNAQMGLNLANGGPATTEGSLMQKHGVNLEIERQDDYGKMQEALVSCANELSHGKKTCATGANFVTIMGDGGPAFLAGVNEALAKMGPEYKAEIVGSTGRSYGEDKFMAPPEVRADAKKARGLLVAGVLKDGDWNIALFFAANNELCNNPDVTTYDPNCLNWVGTSSFVEADDKYIQSYCEERKVVSGNKKTGETRKVCVNGVVTWTPGDVAVATKKGGLVSVLSTRENSGQMPQVIIGLKKWDHDNRDTVKGILKASLEAGDQIKRGGMPVLMKAAAASAAIYKEETPAYWAKYYLGVTEMDATGTMLPLGGSSVFNLADNLRFYGLEEGSANAFAATYVTFGDIAKAQYPKDLPNYPAVGEVLNLTFLQEIAAETADKGQADKPTFTAASPTSVVAKRSWRINFDTGKATFKNGAERDLNELLQQLVIAGDTVVEVVGHTDNVGSPESNLKLSEARANAVKAWLQQKAPGNFGAGRVQVEYKGDTSPVASNDSPDGRAKNRRVDIVLKSGN